MVILVLLAEIAAGPAFAQDTIPPEAVRRLDRHIESSLPGWFEFYRTCHANPELSLQEKESAERIAKLFEKIGLRVTRNIGGYGVVGLLVNGAGPIVLVRGDMDALPIVEETGLAYASKVTQRQADGSTVGVMHACGHDVHMTVLVATAETLSAMKDAWSGTVLFVAQPAEEIGTGSREMLADRLYERFPRPDYALALHVSHEMKVGTVGYSPEWALANVDSVDITIHGKGGHGAYPHQTVDPIVTASQVVLALQTIVSRRLDPRDTAVVTVGSIHGGTKHNVIPDSVTLKLTVRSYTDEVRQTLLGSIRQIATDVCQAANCPKPPDVHHIKDEFTPATYNDPELSASCAAVFEKMLGAENVIVRKPSMGGEDFSRFSRDAKGVKGFIYWLGVVDEARFAESQKPGAAPLPSIHSATFRPDPEPTIRTGVRTMSAAAMSLLKKK